MWVNTEQTLRIKINSLYCSFLGAGGLPAGAEPLASCWDKHFVRLLVLVLWSNARLWLVTAISCHQPNPLSGICISSISNCSSLFLSWCIVHSSVLPSCSPVTDSFPEVPLDLSSIPGCLLSFCFTLLFLLTS